MTPPLLVSAIPPPISSSLPPLPFFSLSALPIVAPPPLRALPLLLVFFLQAPAERVQKGIAHWDKQNHAVPAPNCVLKVREEIIKDEGL